MANDISSVSSSKHTVAGAWIFGSLPLAFFLWIFLFGPDELPPYKHRMLAIIAGLLVGLFTFFLVGSLRVSGHVGSRWAKLALQGGGGLAAFVFVLVWWNAPGLAPVRVTPLPRITIDQNSLLILRPSSGITVFSGSVVPPELCKDLRLMISTDGGHRCFSRDPICTGRNEEWKIDCSQEIDSLKAGTYNLKVIAETVGLSAMGVLKIIDRERSQ